MADKHIAVSGCEDCPAVLNGAYCALRKGLRTLVSRTEAVSPPDCPLREGRVVLFLNEKRHAGTL